MAILVIDVSSSSSRALLYDDSARLIPGAMVRRRYQLQTAPLGSSLIDANQMRLNTEACIDDILQHPAARDIQAVITVTFEGTLLGINREGKPISPLMTYYDTRSSEDARLTGQQLDLPATHQRTGCVHHASYAPVKLHWLSRTEPQLFKSAALWLDAGTFLYVNWLHTARTSFAAASTMGLLDREALTWDVEWLNLLQLSPAQFARLGDYSAGQRGLAEGYAARWTILDSVPFYLAVGDGAAAAVGSGALTTETVALTVNNTAALRRITDEALPPVPPGLWGYRVTAQHHMVGGGTTEGGNIFQWAQQTLALGESYTEEALMTLEPDSHGLTVLPLLAGERSPGWSTYASGTINGLKLATTPLQILQALLESVALRLSLIAEQITHDNAQVMASGAALEVSPAWTVMLANALNRPLHILAETDITARGAAVLALVALGKGDFSTFPPAIARVIEPNPDHAAVYRAARARQTALYENLK
jgi:gluconokinase